MYIILKNPLDPPLLTVKSKPEFSDILAKGQIVGTSCTVFMYNILNFLQYFVQLELEILFNIRFDTKAETEQNLYSIFYDTICCFRSDYSAGLITGIQENNYLLYSPCETVSSF